VWKRLCERDYSNQLKKFDAVDSVEGSSLSWKTIYVKLTKNCLQDYLLKVSIIPPLYLDTKESFEMMEIPNNSWMDNSSSNLLFSIIHGRKKMMLDYFEKQGKDLICSFCNGLIYVYKEGQETENVVGMMFETIFGASYFQFGNYSIFHALTIL
jgi:hypothetical protein